MGKLVKGFENTGWKVL